MRRNPIWILLSLLPSLALSTALVDDSMVRSRASFYPLVGKDPVRSTPQPPKRTLSKEMEERVKETLESGITNIGAPEAAHIENATQKAKSLLVFLYYPAAKADTIEEVPLHAMLSSKSMVAAQSSLAAMEKESTTLTEELSRIPAQVASLTQALVPIEKDLGVLSRAIQSEKEKEFAKDPKNPVNLRAMKYLEEGKKGLESKKEQLRAEKKLLEERRVPLEEQKEKKEKEIFVHRKLIELREKRDLLSQSIREEETQLHADPAKLADLKEKRDGLDQGGWETLLTQVTLKMMEQEGERLGKSIAEESKKASSNPALVDQLQRKRTTLRSAMEKFAQVSDRKTRIKRILAQIKEKLTPAEIHDLILGERAVVTSRSFFSDRIVVLERLASLPPKIRQKLMKQAQRLIEPRMSGTDRISIAKVFVGFERAEDGEEFSKDLSLHKVGPITPTFIKSAANAWRDGRKKFQNSLKRIRSLPIKASSKFVDNFLVLSEDAREEFLSLFSRSPSIEESDVLYLLTGIEEDAGQSEETRELKASDVEAIEKMALFKKKDPKGYEDELKEILIYYKENRDNSLYRALAVKKNKEKDALRKIIVEKLIEEKLRRDIRETVQKELDVENIRKQRLKKIAESKSPDASQLKAKFEQQLTQQVERITNQRLAKQSKNLSVQQKQELANILAEKVKELLEEELENVRLLQIHPLLIPFEHEDIEDDVFSESKHSAETTKKSTSPQSPQSEVESGYDTSDHDSSEAEA